MGTSYQSWLHLWVHPQFTRAMGENQWKRPEAQEHGPPQPLASQAGYSKLFADRAGFHGYKIRAPCRVISEAPFSSVVHWFWSPSIYLYYISKDLHCFCFQLGLVQEVKPFSSQQVFSWYIIITINNLFKCLKFSFLFREFTVKYNANLLLSCSE